MGKRRTELLLYALLLVLPTLVLVGLHWHQLVTDHRTQLAQVPREAEDAARRLRESIVRRVSELIAQENERPFYHYKAKYFPEDTVGADLAFVPSPLVSEPPPQGVLAWFTYPFDKVNRNIDLFYYRHAELTPRAGFDFESLRRSAEAIAERDLADGLLRRISRISGLRSVEVPLTVAAINQSPEQDLDCLRAELPALRQLADEVIDVHFFDFHLRLFFEEDGVARVAATRRVLITPNTKLQDMPPCFDVLGWGATLVEGFFIDPQWLFVDMPAAEAARVLNATDQFMPANALEPAESGVAIEKIEPVRMLSIETYVEEDQDYAPLHVGVSSTGLTSRFRSQAVQLLGVSAMLLISLATGLGLLLRSVRRDLEQAQRTENFVSAVTHELRTPIAAVRMYGEMLRDGWVKDATKADDYYQRIVREARRLETTVERVLEKGRISSTHFTPYRGDLNSTLAPVIQELRQQEGMENVELDLGENLPPVLIHPECVRSILINLLENARKYAPIEEGGEPYLVRTRATRKGCVLEVLDRGPGVPESERQKIFEAFYRVGNEATRSAQGTGIGLHLVAMHARTMKGRVRVLDREGGGTIFRIELRAAPPEDRASRTS